MRLAIDGLRFVALPDARRSGEQEGASLTEEEYQLLRQIVEYTGRRATLGHGVITYCYRKPSGEEAERSISLDRYQERKHALREAVRDARHDHNPEKS